MIKSALLLLPLIVAAHAAPEARFDNSRNVTFFSGKIHPILCKEFNSFFLWLDSPFSLVRFTCEECVREMHGLAAMVKMGAIPIHVSRM